VAAAAGSVGSIGSHAIYTCCAVWPFLTVCSTPFLPQNCCAPRVYHSRRLSAPERGAAAAASPSAAAAAPAHGRLRLVNSSAALPVCCEAAPKHLSSLAAWHAAAFPVKSQLPCRLVAMQASPRCCHCMAYFLPAVLHPATDPHLTTSIALSSNCPSCFPLCHLAVFCCAQLCCPAFVVALQLDASAPAHCVTSRLALLTTHPSSHLHFIHYPDDFFPKLLRD